MIKYLVAFIITFALAFMLYDYFVKKNRESNTHLFEKKVDKDFPQLNLENFKDLDEVIYKKSKLENGLFLSLNGYIKAITPDSEGKIDEDSVIRYMSPEFISQLQNRKDMKKGIKDFSYFNALLSAKLGEYKVYTESNGYLVDIVLALKYKAKAAFYILDRDVHEITVLSHIYGFSLNSGQTWFFAHPSDFTMSFLRKNFPETAKNLPDNTSYRYIKKLSKSIDKEKFEKIKLEAAEDKKQLLSKNFTLNDKNKNYILKPELSEDDIKKLETKLIKIESLFQWLPYSKRKESQ